MTESWFFDLGRDGNIELRSRIEGADGMIGDSLSTCQPGGSILNLSYEQLAKEKSGQIEIDGGKAKIVHARR